MKVAMLLLCLFVQDAKPTKEQVCFREWAKMMRETDDSAKKMANRKESQREAWATKTALAKESKLCAKYRIKQRVLLYAILKDGLLQKWPTESAADLACARVILDPLILKDEIREWEIRHAPPSARSPQIISGAKASIDFYQGVKSSTDPIAPITICKTKSPAGETCNRKVVGHPGTKCYEHRG